MKILAAAAGLFFLISGAAVHSFAKDGAAGEACQPSPAIRAMLEKTAAAGNALDALNEENAASLWYRRELAAKNIIQPIAVAEVRDLVVPARNHQIPVRIYDPRGGKAARKRKLPTLVFYHGGGWTLGSLATYDSLARALAVRTPAVVISVDYRLAPEHPFPAGVEDSQLAFDWVVRNLGELGGDPARLGLAGDSGGANLATVVARRAAGEGIPLRLEALLYPSVNLSALNTPSFEENGEGYLLTKRSVEAFRNFYVPKEKDRLNPDASPLLAAKEGLAKLPSTFLLVLECDPLRDEGLAYGQKLREGGVKVQLLRKSEFVHGFLNFYNSAAARDVSKAADPVVGEIAAWMRAEFAKPAAKK